MLHIVDVRGVSSPSFTAKVAERMDAHEIGFFDLRVCSESLLGSIENRCEEDIEQ